MASHKKGGLGRGLGALISGPASSSEETARAAQSAAAVPVDPSSRILELNPKSINPNPQQPRTAFDEDALQELAESIRRDGVLEPVIVRRRGNKYELVSGERRVRASVLAGVDFIPAICREVSDDEMLKFGLIENIQREDLNAIELAKAYQALIDQFGWTQEELADQVGKKRATVTNTLRLLNLPPDVQRAVANGAISMGHARALLALPSAKVQTEACRAVIAQGLSVRQVERMATPGQPKKKQTAARDPNIASVEDELRRTLGTRVHIRTHGTDKTKGTLEIEFYNLDDFERILDRLRTAK